MYPDAEKIILLTDNLNTYKAASLYKRYPAPEARKIIKCLEVHYTLKHGSCLAIVEIELNVMSRQCLSYRIESSLLSMLSTHGGVYQYPLSSVKDIAVS